MGFPDVVIVSGSRKWKAIEPVIFVLGIYQRGTILIHGGAPGLDSIADEIGRRNDFDVWRLRYFESNWREARNESMVAVGVALQRIGHIVDCHAFPLPDSKGTPKFMRIARREGLMVHEH